jgi:hypothetical protein
MAQVIPTSSITFVETEHGRLRRKQRGIDKKDLQRAKKYGTRLPTRPRLNGDPTSKYTYQGIVYIVNDRTGAEVTSYAIPIKLDLIPVTKQMVQHHEWVRNRAQIDLDSWTSNTVLVVDRSGSMRTGDVWGTRNRLSSVWLCTALDYIAHKLETGNTTSTDILSIITLEENPVTVIHNEPTTWVLYNKIASIYNSQSIEPRGHGPFLPSLRSAEKCLLNNPCASCAIGLVFLSDGKPSDTFTSGLTPKENLRRRDKLICEQVENLAKQFGRRLTFQAVGLGDSDFSTLKLMVDAAADYGAKASFCTPSMNTLSLGEVFTSVATSVTSTQTEMTDILTLKQSRVRNVLRESKTRASTHITAIHPNDFYLYPLRTIQRKVYTERWEEGPTGKAMLLKKYEEVPLQNAEARYVAFSKQPFGEGAERFAYRFYELFWDARTIVGKPLVAKESRYVSEDDTPQARDDYVRTFCSTQQLARRLAMEFNAVLDQLPRVDPRTPRISFLDCSIYELTDIYLGKQKVLVEEKLDHNNWRKWNSNNGFVEGMKSAPVFSEDGLHDAMRQLAIVGELDMIAEGSDSDESSDDDDIFFKFSSKLSPIVFTPFEVAQAFSHYTYLATGKKRLVCDLQGVYDEKRNELKLSDPVIHYYNQFRSDRRLVHGRTDRGRKGIAMFFETHKNYCGQLCRLANGGLRKHRRVHATY